MAKFDKKIETVAQTPMQKLQWLEREEAAKRDDGFKLDPEIFNLMIDMVKKGESHTKVFNWLKRIERIVRQPNGVAFYGDDLCQRYLFMYFGKQLQEFFKTDKLCVVYGAKRTYLKDPNVKEALSEKGYKLLQSIKRELGVSGLVKRA